MNFHGGAILLVPPPLTLKFVEKDPLHSSNTEERSGSSAKNYFLVVPIPFGPSPTTAVGIGVPAVSVPSAFIVNMEI